MCIDSSYFVTRLHHDLICPICLGILCIDFVIDENEHLYCRPCILRWIRSANKRCPVGNEDIDIETLKAGPRIVKNLLSDAEVHCKFLNEGCNEILKHKDIVKHEAECMLNPRNSTNKEHFNAKNVIINGDKVKSQKLLDMPSNSLCRMAIFNNGTELLITDEINGLIHVCDFNGNLLNSINPEGVLKRPIGLCVLNNKNYEEIYVGDTKCHQIFVFNSDFSYKKQFGSEKLNIPQYMEIDDFEGRNFLYVSDFKNDEITIWNTNTDEFVDVINIDSPMFIKFNFDYLFVACSILCTVDQNDKNKIEKINKGSNSIFMINKCSPYEIVRQIKRDDWLSLSALHVTSDMNIYTIAYEFNENCIKSEYKYFYIIDQMGNIVKKIYLHNTQLLGDVLFMDNKLVFCVIKDVVIIEIE